jgi:RNA polymerase sigma factor (sigma-70 family)
VRRAVASDAELIGWSLAGDPDAFVEVLDRHESAVWGYLVRRAGRDRAEDLLGEVWATAYGSRGTYDRSYPSARPWLFGVALNALRHHWRSRLDTEHLTDETELAGSEDPWPGVDERIHGEAVLRTALARLRPEHREVLVLVVWEDLSIADAARVLRIPAGTARYLLHQARRDLRDAPGMVALLTEYNTEHKTMKEHR